MWTYPLDMTRCLGKIVILAVAVECAGCFCPELYSPVCDTENTTHNSACHLRCNGKRYAYNGVCRNTSGDPDIASAQLRYFVLWMFSDLYES